MIHQLSQIKQTKISYLFSLYQVLNPHYRPIKVINKSLIGKNLFQLSMTKSLGMKL